MIILQTNDPILHNISPKSVAICKEERQSNSFNIKTNKVDFIHLFEKINYVVQK